MSDESEKSHDTDEIEPKKRVFPDINIKISLPTVIIDKIPALPSVITEFFKPNVIDTIAEIAKTEEQNDVKQRVVRVPLIT